MYTHKYLVFDTCFVFTNVLCVIQTHATRYFHCQNDEKLVYFYPTLMKLTPTTLNLSVWKIGTLQKHKPHEYKL